MLVQGNSKLGRLIWGFSIPAGDTCPGKSERCDDRCYAQKGMFVMPAVKRAHARNLEATKMSDFADRIIEEIRKHKCSVVRIHVAGDYYSVAYIQKWHKIVKACPDVRFFTYTRSWRLPKLREAIEKYVKDCPNLRMWYSVDGETGNPVRVPKRVRTAYMAVAMHDIPSNKMDLVFRDYGIRGAVQKRINGVLVCPPENGVTDLTCEKCGICWQRTTVPKGPPDSKRLALSLVA
jgi:hypothetical protein